MTRAQAKRYFIPAIGGVALVALALGFLVTSNVFLKSFQDRMEWLIYDLRLQYTLPESVEPHPIIAIIDIDEKSLGVEGRWPWPRTKIAQLVEGLRKHGVALSIFDIFFVEPEENIALMVRNALGEEQDTSTLVHSLDEIVPRFDGDSILAEAIASQEVVLGHLFLNQENNGVQLSTPLTLQHPALEKVTIPRMDGHTGTLPIMLAAAKRGGFTNGVPDADGNTRRSPMLLRYEDNIYSSLSLEASQAFLAIDTVALKTATVGDEEVVEFINLDFYDIPTNGDGAVLIPFRGPSPTFRYISATDVIQGNIESGVLEGLIAFIGTSAQGLGDLRATPVGSQFPGVEVHASILAGILDQNIPREPKWAEGANFLFMLAIGLILAFTLPLLSPGWLITLTLCTLATLVTFNVWVWVEHMLALSLSTPFLMIALLALTNFAYGYVSESKDRRQLKGFFGQYVPPELVEEMSRNPENFGSEGERKELSVLFSDIRGFTTISEALSATELAQMLNRFFTPMTEIIFNNKGTIDKYVGDMIMAFWGAPLEDKDHALHSVLTGLDMLTKLELIQEEFRTLGLPEINIGIGINSGDMSVGNMGSEFRRAYTVLGDNVNLGARLEGLTKFYGVKFLVGENTRHGMDEILFRRMDVVRVKGKHEPVTIYEPLCLADKADAELKQEVIAHEEALDLYLQQQWNEAKTRFQSLADNSPDTTVYKIYLERIENINNLHVGPEWEGVFEHTSK